MTKYLLLKHYAPIEGVPPIHEWKPEEVNTHVQFMNDLAGELKDNGEWVDGTGLTGPELAKIVQSDGASPPVVSDGPFAESKELLAGFMTIDVESEERALEVAAKLSSAPGPDGTPIREPIQVRRVMEVADPSDDEWRDAVK